MLIIIERVDLKRFKIAYFVKYTLDEKVLRFKVSIANYSNRMLDMKTGLCLVD